MRVGHTARLCKYEKCSSVFSCGEEKYHHGEIDSRGTHNSIKKIKDDIAELETDLKLKEGQSKKLSECLPNKNENARMEENGGHYIDAGVKKCSGGSSVSQNKLPQLILGYIYILKYLQSNFIG